MSQQDRMYREIWHTVRFLLKLNDIYAYIHMAYILQFHERKSFPYSFYISFYSVCDVIAILYQL